MPCGQLRFEPTCVGGNLVSEDIALPIGYYIPSAYSGSQYKKRWLNDMKPESRTWQGRVILTYSALVDKSSQIILGLLDFVAFCATL